MKSSSDTDAAVTILEANASASGIALGQIYYGPSLALNYNDPTVDPRTPDIIVTPNVGVTYSGSTAKLAEHGGFAHDDTNVILLLSKPSFQPQTVKRFHCCRCFDRGRQIGNVLIRIAEQTARKGAEGGAFMVKPLYV